MKTLYVLLIILLSVPAFAQVDDPFDESSKETETTNIRAKPLDEVFRQYWDRWGKGNPRISKMELLALLGNPLYKQEPSAAMVALLKAMKTANLDDVSLDEAISKSKER